jgi:hypothetical protein
MLAEPNCESPANVDGKFLVCVCSHCGGMQEGFCCEPCDCLQMQLQRCTARIVGGSMRLCDRTSVTR